MKKHAYVDDNLHAHIRSLRIVVAVLSVLLALSTVVLYLSNRTHRLSLPPRLDYGATINTGSIHSWEVYSFAGYIWQYMNRCETDCSTELAVRQQQMISFITPGFAAALANDRAGRTAELKDRSRYVLPLDSGWDPRLVTRTAEGYWQVVLNVLLVETLRGVEVKRTPLRYTLKVIELRADPEFNPWGLYLDALVVPPERISEA